MKTLKFSDIHNEVFYAGCSRTYQQIFEARFGEMIYKPVNDSIGISLAIDYRVYTSKKSIEIWHNILTPLRFSVYENENFKSK
jgi:hypothetical protein